LPKQFPAQIERFIGHDGNQKIIQNFNIPNIPFFFATAINQRIPPVHRYDDAVHRTR